MELLVNIMTISRRPLQLKLTIHLLEVFHLQAFQHLEPTLM